MANKTLSLTKALHAYLVGHSVREPDILQRLRAETAEDSMSMMQIGPEQGQFMQLLVRLMGAKNCLEVGVFTGYSSLAVALALPADGRIVACDVSEKWTAIARKYWAEAGVAARIDLRIAPALSTLDGLIESGEGRFVRLRFHRCRQGQLSGVLRGGRSLWFATAGCWRSTIRYGVAMSLIRNLKATIPWPSGHSTNACEPTCECSFRCCRSGMA